MASLRLIGSVADIDLDDRDDDGGVVARCVDHKVKTFPFGNGKKCEWTKVYDDLADASEYAVDHADHGYL